MNNADHNPQFELVARAIECLATSQAKAPDLAGLAAELGVSPFHLQRVFTAWAGVSPKRFVQYLSKERALAALREADDVLGASLAAGISSPGRMHDLLVSCEAVSPGEVIRLGARLEIRYAFASTMLGQVLIGLTERGICHLRFVADEGDALAELRAEWPLARLVATPEPVGLARELFEPGRQARLWLRGTNFQIKVWEALLQVPDGAVISYGRLACRLGAPGAARAVGRAVGANPVAVLIPCHRVIRDSGVLGQYRWGAARKAALLGREAAWLEHQKARHGAGLSGVRSGLPTAAGPALDA